MGRAHEIRIASETGAFEKGIKSGVIQPLEDVTDALKTLEKASGKSTDGLARELEKAGEKSQELRREIKRTADAIEDDFKKGYKSAGDAADDGFRRMGSSAEEVSSELKQNLGETFSSFRGDLEDLPQIAQDTLGGLAGSGALGGIPGLVATAAGAAGIGLLIGAFDQAGEAQERLKEKAGEWAEAFIENGSRVLSTAQVTAKGMDLIANNYAEVAANAEKWGVSEQTAAAAMAGSETAIGQVEKAVSGLRDEYERMLKTEDPFDEFGNANGNLLTAEKNWRSARDALGEVTGAMTLGAQQADVFSYFLQDVAANTEGATTKVDEFGDSIVTLPDGTTIYIDAETGQATTDVDAIERRIYGLPNRTVTLTANDSSIASAMARWDNWTPKAKTAWVNYKSNGGTNFGGL